DGDLDDTVRTIATVYLPRGLVDTVTQLDDNDDELDQVQYGYDDWGNVTAFVQDPDSAIGGAGANGPGRRRDTVGDGWSASTPSDGVNTLRLATQSLPGLALPNNYYGAANGLNDKLSRVEGITNAGVFDLTTYTYMGLATLVGTVYE